MAFVYQFVPAAAEDTGVTLLLLHGTGGNEHDLMPLGRELLPGAALLSPRGRVLEQGMPRFFRRIAEGVFDVEDLKFQTHALHDFVMAESEHQGVDKNKIVAVGYSNGANIAASLLFLHPHLLSGAVLFRAMVPFTPAPLPNLNGVKILFAAGTDDPVIPRENAKALLNLLEGAGAGVEAHWHEGGHELGQDDVTAAKRWLLRNYLTARAS